MKKILLILSFGAIFMAIGQAKSVSVTDMVQPSKHDIISNEMFSLTDSSATVPEFNGLLLSFDSTFSEDSIYLISYNPRYTSDPNSFVTIRLYPGVWIPAIGRRITLGVGTNIKRSVLLKYLKLSTRF